MTEEKLSTCTFQDKKGGDANRDEQGRRRDFILGVKGVKSRVKPWGGTGSVGQIPAT